MPNPSEFCSRSAELPEYLQGTLDAAAAKELVLHVAACRDCREDLTVLRSLQQRWGDDTEEPTALERRLRGHIAPSAFKAPPRAGRTGLLVGVAGTVLLLTALLLLFPFLVQEPRNRQAELVRFREDSVQYLLSSQTVNGSICGTREPAQRYVTGITALSMQALLAHAERKECREALQRAMEFLLRQQDADGMIGPPVSDALYNHAPALIALLRCSKEGDGLRTKTAIRKALSALVACQKEDGGFGYGDGLGGNSVISIWPLEALLLARKLNHAGLDGAISRLQGFLEKCRRDGHLVYAPDSQAKATSALAALNAYSVRLVTGGVAPATSADTYEAFSLSFLGQSGSEPALERMLDCTQNGAGTSFNAAYCSVTRDPVAAAAMSLLAIDNCAAVLSER